MSDNATITIGADTQAAEDELRSLAAQINDLEAGVGKVGDATEQPFEIDIDKGKVAAAIATVTALLVALDKLSQESHVLKNVSAAMTIDISAAHAALGGLVKQSDLATLSITAVRTGVVKTGDDFAELAAVADRLGTSIGMDTTQAIESLSNALGKGKSGQLAALGVTLKASEAQQIYAERLGIAQRDLTEQQKAEAFMVIGRERAVEAANNIATATDGAAEAFQRGKIGMLDLSDAGLGFTTTAGRQREALAQLSDELLATRDRMHVHGAVQDQLTSAMVRSGLSYREAKDALSQLTAEANRRERKVEVERIEAENQAHEKSLSLMRSRITELAREREIMAAAGDAADMLADALEREYDARIELATASGDLAAAEEIAHKQEVAAQKESTRVIKEQEAAAKAGAARAKERLRKDQADFERLITTPFASSKDGTSMLDVLSGFERQEREQTRASREWLLGNTEHEVNVLAARHDLLRANTKAAVDGSVEQLAQAQTEHYRRLQMLEARATAEAAAFEARREQIDFELQWTDDVSVQASLLHERQQLLHNHELARMGQKRAAIQSLVDFEIEAEANRDARRQESAEKLRATVATSSTLLESGATVAELAMVREGEAGEKTARAFMKVKGIMAIAQGSYQLVEAVAAFASFNYAQGAAHIMASATAFATGAQLMAGNPGGAGRGAAGASGPAAPTVFEGAGGRRERDQSDAPTIPGSSADRGGSQAGAPGKGNGDTFVFNVTGTVDDESALKIAQGLDRLSMQRRSNA